MRGAAITLAVCLFAAPALGGERATYADFPLGAPVAQLASLNVAHLACALDGNLPGQSLSGFAAFADCPADAHGERAVTFTYDDTAEHAARAADDPAAAWGLGTALDYYPIIPAAVFDASGRLVAMRLVTDPRPDKRKDQFLLLRPRAEHFLLADRLMALYGLAPADCHDLPAAQNESPVLGMFVKRDCTAQWGTTAVHIESRLFRRAGERDVDPTSGEPTEGQDVSLTSAEFRLAAPRS